jgi:hypothetical protein
MQSSKAISLIELGWCTEGENPDFSTWAPILEKPQYFQTVYCPTLGGLSSPTEFGHQQRQLNVTGVTSFAIKALQSFEAHVDMDAFRNQLKKAIGRLGIFVEDSQQLGTLFRVLMNNYDYSEAFWPPRNGIPTLSRVPKLYLISSAMETTWNL